MSDFEKINLIRHVTKKLYEGTLSENDFKVIVDECSKSPFEIITQKIKKMGENAIKNFKIRKERGENESNSISFSDFDNFIIDYDDD